MPRKPIPFAKEQELIVDTPGGRVVVPGPKSASGRGKANSDLGAEGWAEVRDDRLRADSAPDARTLDDEI